MLKKISCLIDGIKWEKTEQICLANLRATEGKRYTNLTVHVEIVSSMEKYLKTIEAICADFGFVNYKVVVEREASLANLKLLRLEFADGIHHEELYAIVALYRYLTPREANFFFERIDKILLPSGYNMKNLAEHYTIGYGKLFYALHMMALTDGGTTIFHSYRSEHAFLYAIPGLWHEIITWKQRLSPNTCMANLKVPMSSIKINNFFMNREVTPITRDPKFSAVLRSFEDVSSVYLMRRLVSTKLEISKLDGNYVLN